MKKDFQVKLPHPDWFELPGLRTESAFATEKPWADLVKAPVKIDELQMIELTDPIAFENPFEGLDFGRDRDFPAKSKEVPVSGAAATKLPAKQKKKEHKHDATSSRRSKMLDASKEMWKTRMDPRAPLARRKLSVTTSETVVSSTALPTITKSRVPSSRHPFWQSGSKLFRKPSLKEQVATTWPVPRVRINRHPVPTVTLPTRRCTCSRCTPDLYNKTTHAHELRWFTAGQDTLSPFQYEPLLLAETAIATFSVPSYFAKAVRFKDYQPGWMHAEQFVAMQAWKNWRLDQSEAQTWRKSVELSKYDPGVLLKDVVEIFNQIFFLGELPKVTGVADGGLLKIQWWPAHIKRRAQTHTTIVTTPGSIAGIHVKGEKRKSTTSSITTISLSPYHPAHVLNSRGLISTILHELCHAFLQRHSCYGGNGQGCNLNPVCIKFCRQNYGDTSHGRAWQLLAAAIEKAAPTLLKGFKVDLGRCEAAVQEVSKAPGSGWWPGAECDMKLLGDRVGWRVKAVMRSRDDDIVGFAKVKAWVLREMGCPSQSLAVLRSEATLFSNCREGKEAVPGPECLSDDELVGAYGPV